MKTISALMLLMLTVATLTACDSGKGPAKPASEASTQTSK